jgi:hypothetical protein
MVSESLFKRIVSEMKDCCRRAQTVTERALKLSGSKFIKQTGSDSVDAKGGFPYVPFTAGYRNGGVQLVTYTITSFHGLL